MKVFSFCLYGTDRNYYEGLLENIQIIQQYYPDYEIFVYRGICPSEWTLRGINVIYTSREGPINMLYRYLPLTFADSGFVRDTDSRITERDRWCMDAFLKSSRVYHIIRDHVWHRSKIMGGMFGWKCSMNLPFRIHDETSYGMDEALLSQELYPLIVSQTLVHTNMFAYIGEHSERIEIPQKDAYDFVGNVIWDAQPKFTYDYDLVAQVDALRGQDQFALICFLTDMCDPQSISYSRRTPFYDTCYIANFYMNRIEKAQYWLAQFEFAEITCHVYQNAQYLLRKMGRLVATCNPDYVGHPGDVVIHYGNYPDWHKALPCSTHIYRHISKFFDTQHDFVDYHPVWSHVDIVYILNLEERVDRFYEVLHTLGSLGVPLDRVYHYKASKDVPSYVGATKNHVDVIRHFRDSGKDTCLVLEDDFVFADDRGRIYSTLERFWTTPLDYNICFLALSKYGERRPYNDLVSETRQTCTTSSAYFLRKETVETVLNTVDEGLRLMTETGDYHTYCIDRYWCKLPNLYSFKTKLGFQRPGYSNLTGKVVANLD